MGETAVSKFSSDKDPTRCDHKVIFFMLWILSHDMCMHTCMHVHVHAINCSNR